MIVKQNTYYFYNIFLSGTSPFLFWNRFGDEKYLEYAKVAPLEFLFIHGGNTSNISDFSWDPTE